MEKKSEKKENKLEEGEINSETEMDKISEGNEVRLKQMRNLKKKRTTHYK